MDTDTCPPDLLVSQGSPSGVDVSLPPPGWRTLMALLRQPGVPPHARPFFKHQGRLPFPINPCRIISRLGSFPNQAVCDFDMCWLPSAYQNRSFRQTGEMDGGTPSISPFCQFISRVEEMNDYEQDEIKNSNSVGNSYFDYLYFIFLCRRHCKKIGNFFCPNKR